MATVFGLDADRLEALEADTVIGGHIDGSGHLILEQHDGSTIDAGNATGPTGPAYTDDPFKGRAIIPDLIGNMRHYVSESELRYAFGHYYKDEIGIVHLSGLLQTSGAVAIGSTLFTLPSGFRPAYSLRFTVSTGTSAGVIVVRPNGNVILAGLITNAATGPTYAAGVYISLDAISFPAEDVSSPPVWTSLTSRLVNGWTAVGTSGGDTYAPPRAWLDPAGDLHIQGVLKNTSATTSIMISALPTSLLVSDTTGGGQSGSIGAGAEHTKYVRIDLDLNARTINFAGLQNSSNASAVSLDQIIIPTSLKPARWQTLVYKNNWVSYGNPWIPFQIYRNNIGRVYIRGLVRDGDLSVPIGLDFSGSKFFEPQGQRIFLGWSASGSARIDVAATNGTKNGYVAVFSFADGGSTGFVELANTHWDTTPR